MLLHKFLYICKKCKITYKAAQLPGNRYGDFLMRTNTGKVKYILALDSKEFAEVSNLVKTNDKLAYMSDLERVDIMHQIFSIACDPEPDGSVYNITQKPICPVCCKVNLEDWGPTDPPEYIEEYIEHVTHETWNKLSLEEKREQVDKAVSAYFK